MLIPEDNLALKHLNVSIVNGFDKLEEKKFGIIYTSHVLEHFTGLSEIFFQINAHSKTGTTLFIEVPNFDYEQSDSSILSIIWAIHPLEFSSEFFTRNLPRYGFEILGCFDSWEGFPLETKEKKFKG